jgi:hypothetical protein
VNFLFDEKKARTDTPIPLRCGSRVAIGKIALLSIISIIQVR